MVIKMHIYPRLGFADIPVLSIILNLANDTGENFDT